MLHSFVLIDWMLCLFCHVCTVVDHLDHLEVVRMQFGARLAFKFSQILLLKILLKHCQNTLYLAFNFHLKICLDLDFAPFDKVVEFKFLNNFYFYPKS